MPCDLPSVENLIAYGSAIKAVEADDGTVTVSGYLVRFGSESDTDRTGDFFSAKTNFGPAGRTGARVPVFYHHGLDAGLGKRQIGEGTVEETEEGLWLEAQLKARDEYERKYLRQAVKLISLGKAAYSSGAPPWVVDYETLTVKGAKVRHITQWPIGEASITPTPAEDRNVVTLKSLAETPAETPNETPAADEAADETLKALDAILRETESLLLTDTLDLFIAQTGRAA